MDQQKIYEKAEKSAHDKIMEFTEQPEIQAQLSEAFFIWNDNPDLITEYQSEEELDNETFTKFFDWFIHDFRLLDSQKRIMERFYEEQEDSLSDVEKEIVRDWQKSATSIFEVVEVESGEGCTIKDIFTENTIYVKDKKASKQLSESELISARPLKTNDVYYFSGLISAFPKILKQKILKYFEEDFKLYKEEHGKGMKVNDFLKDWGYQLINFVEDILAHPQYLNPDGEEFVIAKAFYDIQDRKDLIKAARAMKELREVTKKSADFSVFIVNDDETAFIEVDKSRLTLECNSEKKLSEVKELLEKNFEDQIEYREDKVQPLESFVSADTEDQVVDLEVNSLDNYYDEWIKTPLEKLGGLSPVEAANDSEMKDELDNVLFEMEKLFEDAKKHGEPYYEVKRIREKLKPS